VVVLLLLSLSFGGSGCDKGLIGLWRVVVMGKKNEGCFMLKKVGKKMKSVGYAVGAALVSASPALATTTFVDGVDVDIAPVLTLAGVVLIGLGGIWAIRKCIKLMNRS